MCAVSWRLECTPVTTNSVLEIIGERPDKTAGAVLRHAMRHSTILAFAAGLLTVGSPAGQAYARPAEPPPPHRHMNLPKPTPPGGDALPFVVTGSATAPTAPTVAVIGDSVARDYAYYLGRELGPHGVRVVDGALSGCPVGTLP